MATGQTVLNTMELLNQELQLQPGDADVVTALVALNRAQDYLEAILAADKWVKGGTTGTVVTASSTETTAFPTGLLRLDRMVILSSTTSRPEYELTPERDQVTQSAPSWPYSTLTEQAGKPVKYFTDGRLIYWSPLPDAIYTLRWYGLQAAADISAAGDYLYDDVTILPIASFATRLMRMGVDDDQNDIATLAENTFRPVIKQMKAFNRDGAQGLRYLYYHET